MKINFSLAASQRGELIFSFLRRIALVVMMITLWSFTLEEGETNKYIAYFSIFYFVFDVLMTGRAGSRFVRDVLTGKINTFLLKPIYYPLYRIMDVLTLIFARSIIPMTLFVIAAILFPAEFGPGSFTSFVIFLPTIIMAVFLYQFIMMTLASLSLWFANIGFLFTVYGLVISFVNGGLIPISEYPENIQKILFFLPTSYGGGIQVDMYLGRYSVSESLTAFFVVSAWTLFFAFVSNRVYMRGLSKLEAVGG